MSPFNTKIQVRIIAAAVKMGTIFDTTEHFLKISSLSLKDINLT